MLHLFRNKIFSEKYHILRCLCEPFFMMPSTSKPKLTTRCILYLYFLPHFESFTTSLFYLILNQILPLQTCFSYIFVVYYSPLQSYLVHIGPTQSILSTLVLFSLLWFYLVYYVHFHLIRSIWSYSIHFASIWFGLVLFSPFCSLWFFQSTLVQLGPFDLIWSIQFTLVLDRCDFFFLL